MKSYEKNVNFIIQRYFYILQRLLVDYLGYSLKPEKPGKIKPASRIPEETKKSSAVLLTKAQIENRGTFQRLLMETLVVLCTKFNEHYIHEIQRTTWETILVYFLRSRKSTEFQLQFYRLFTAGFKLGTENIVLDIILYQNIIGELWEIVQEQERDTIIFKGSPHNEMFYAISNKFITFLESIEGNPNYPVMNAQFAVNLAWKKLREFRGKGKEVAALNASGSSLKASQFSKAFIKYNPDRRVPSATGGSRAAHIPFPSTHTLPESAKSEKQCQRKDAKK